MRCCLQSVLQTAARIHEGMGYMEPPRQFQPVKHCLAWVLLQLRQHQQAFQVCLPAKACDACTLLLPWPPLLHGWESRVHVSRQDTGFDCCTFSQACILQVFQEDLDVHPNTGWALLGQAEAEQQAGSMRSADELRERHMQAWQHADAPLASPCLMYSEPYSGPAGGLLQRLQQLRLWH